MKKTAIWICVLACTACAGPGYYYQAAKGQFELMRARQAVDEIITNPNSDPVLVERLQATREILDFADQELDLPVDDSYSHFVSTGRSAVVWNVIAAPEFSLEARKWCFPVAGCVPYRGYFEESKAREFAARQSRKRFDVSVQGVGAYSTLGWFNDPLLDTILNRDQASMAETLFHELAHRKLYLKGDTRFSESYASFVAMEGVRHWLGSTGNESMLASWENHHQALDQFRDLQAETRSRLADLYQSELPVDAMRVEKAAIFDAFENDYRNLVREEWKGEDRFAAWVASNRNNAALSLFADYFDGICAFESLFVEAGRDFRRFHQLAAHQMQLDDAGRRHWMTKSCTDGEPDIAQDVGL